MATKKKLPGVPLQQSHRNAKKKLFHIPQSIFNTFEIFSSFSDSVFFFYRLFYIESVFCSLGTKHSIRKVFFVSIFSFCYPFFVDTKNEILSAISANLLLLLFPSFYPFSNMLSFHISVTRVFISISLCVCLPYFALFHSLPVLSYFCL